MLMPAADAGAGVTCNRNRRAMGRHVRRELLGWVLIVGRRHVEVALTSPWCTTTNTGRTAPWAKRHA